MILQHVRIDLEALEQHLDIVAKEAGGEGVVDHVEVSEYQDWTGEDALKVVVILDESLPRERRASWKTLQPMERAIHQAVLDQGIDLFPYIRYIKASELAQIEEDMAAEDGEG